jgi:hypothetical protein
MERGIIKLWKQPADLSQKFGWYVFTLSDESNYFIREIRIFYLDSWERIQERVESGEWDKNILEYYVRHYVRHGKIAKPLFDKHMALLAQIPIPLWANSPMGYDGISYGIEFFKGESWIKLTWWEEGSAEWKPIVDWWRETEALLIEALNKKE